MINNSPQEIWNKIITANRLISIVDSRYDLDSFGSNFALKNVLRAFGKDIELIYSQSAKPEAKKYFDLNQLKQNVDISKLDFSEYDVILIFDCAGIYHLTPQYNELAFPKGSTVINIDHHSTNDFFGTFNYVFPRGSTTSLLFEIFESNGLQVEKEVAEMLLRGLLSDTGFLQFDSVKSEDFGVISKLISAGADYFNVVWDLTYNESLENIKFKAHVFSNFILDKEKRYGYVVTTNKEIERLGIDKKQVTVNAADLIRREKDVDFVFTVSEDSEVKNKFWVSFRARTVGTNVLVLAERIGKGGGHVMAAGLQLEGFDDTDKVVEYIKSKIEEFRSEIFASTN